MQRVKINELIWDDFNTSHICKHYVTISDVEEVLQDRKTKFIEASGGRIFVLGCARRCFLSIVLTKETSGKFYVVTARDMSELEMRFL